MGELTGPHVGLGYLAAVLESESVNSTVVDFICSEAKTAKTIEEFRKLEHKFYDTIRRLAKRHDLIGITGTSQAYCRMLQAARAARSGNADAEIIFGGPHVSLMQNFAPWKDLAFRDCRDLDILVEGEGEETLRDLVSNFDNAHSYEEVKGITFRQSNKIRSNPRRPFIENLNDLPFPAWEKFSLRSYPRVLNVVAARGCKYNCAFCDERVLWGRCYRARDSQNVISEIKRDVEEFNIHTFRFSDSSLTSNTTLEEICETVIEEKLDIRWGAFARVDEVSRALLRKMYRAGCRILYFGIESGVQEVLNAMRKGFIVSQAEKAISLTKEERIAVAASFILGFPGETYEMALDTIRFAKKLNADVCSWHIFSPSLEMVANSGEDTRKLYKDFSWRNFNVDVPSHLIKDLLSSFPEILVDRHTLLRLLLENENLSIDEFEDVGVSFTSLSLRETFDLIQSALSETKRTEDLDEMRLLLETD